MKTIGLVTINYNSEKETHACLVSLQKMKVPEGFTLQITVVDNASTTPFTLSFSEKKNWVTLLRSEKNLGFTGGNNIGIQSVLAKGCEYILLLNNDTIVDENLLINLLGYLQSDEKIGGVVPKIYFAKGHEFHKEKYKKEDLGNVFWYAGGMVDYANVFTRHRGVDEVDHGQYNTPEKVDFATGCCLLLKREVLEKVGVFDNNYFLYFEDGDLSQRIRKAGYTLWYVPSAIVWHVNAASSGSGSTLHDYYLTRNRMYFGMKYAPFRAKIALIRESMRLLVGGREWQKKGIRDFYLGKMGKGSWRK
jgi:GT2 family glycosyltransferase